MVIEPPKEVSIAAIISREETPKPIRPRDKLLRLDDTMASTFYENE